MLPFEKKHNIDVTSFENEFDSSVAQYSRKIPMTDHMEPYITETETIKPLKW